MPVPHGTRGVPVLPISQTQPIVSATHECDIRRINFPGEVHRTMTLTDALEQHWAVRAVEPARHRLALATAHRLLEENGADDVRPLTPPEHAALSDVATAYDIAVQELVLRETASAQLLALAQQLRASANTALLLRLALRRASDAHAPSAIDALHRSALAVVADHPEHVERDAAAIVPDDTDGDTLALVRARAAAVWCGLLAPDVRARLPHLIGEIAALRETLTGIPVRTPAGDTAQEREARARSAFGRQAIAAVVDASAELASYLRHGEHVDAVPRLAKHLRTARMSAPGDPALRIALAWLVLAATVTANEQARQLSLLDAAH